MAQTKALSKLDEMIKASKDKVKRLSEKRKAELAKSKVRDAAQKRKDENRTKIIIGALLLKHDPDAALQLLNFADDKNRDFLRKMIAEMKEVAVKETKINPVDKDPLNFNKASF